MSYADRRRVGGRTDRDVLGIARALLGIERGWHRGVQPDTAYAAGGDEARGRLMYDEEFAARVRYMAAAVDAAENSSAEENVEAPIYKDKELQELAQKYWGEIHGYALKLGPVLDMETHRGLIECKKQRLLEELYAEARKLGADPEQWRAAVDFAADAYGGGSGGAQSAVRSFRPDNQGRCYGCKE